MQSDPSDGLESCDTYVSPLHHSSQFTLYSPSVQEYKVRQPEHLRLRSREWQDLSPLPSWLYVSLEHPSSSSLPFANTIQLTCFPTIRYAQPDFTEPSDSQHYREQKKRICEADEILQYETERLDLQYEILKVLFKGRNFFAPLKDPRRILDIGTGTGKWAIEMGMCRSVTFLFVNFMLTNRRKHVPTCRGTCQSAFISLPVLINLGRGN